MENLVESGGARLNKLTGTGLLFPCQPSFLLIISIPFPVSLSSENVKIIFAEFIHEAETKTSHISSPERFLVKGFSIEDVAEAMGIKDIVDIEAE